MKTPQTMTRLSASLLGMTPEATQSVTALATAAWAGPNICTAWAAPLIVTLVINTVAGLHTRFGVNTASRFEWPAFWLARALAKAMPTGPALSPMSRSMWATSLPSPTSDSPMNIDMTRSPWVYRNAFKQCKGLYMAQRLKANKKIGKRTILGTKSVKGVCEGLVSMNRYELPMPI